MILVNLTCGRNPWKVASTGKDSTYRAFRANEDFLKDILPLSEDLNDILKMIFIKDPGQRITLPELRDRIVACPSFSKFEAPIAVTMPIPRYTTSVKDFSPFVAQSPIYQDCLPYQDATIAEVQAFHCGSSYASNLSPTSSHSSMESMDSDHSDNSSAASEVGSPREYVSLAAQPYVVKSSSSESYPSETWNFPTTSSLKGLDQLAHHASYVLNPLTYTN